MMGNPEYRDKEHGEQKKNGKRAMIFIEIVRCQHGNGDDDIKIHADGGPVLQVVDNPTVDLVPFECHVNSFCCQPNVFFRY
jgi:hypothetical protein